MIGTTVIKQHGELCNYGNLKTSVGYCVRPNRKGLHNVQVNIVKRCVQHAWSVRTSHWPEHVVTPHSVPKPPLPSIKLKCRFVKELESEWNQVQTCYVFPCACHSLSCISAGHAWITCHRHAVTRRNDEKDSSAIFNSVAEIRKRCSEQDRWHVSRMMKILNKVGRDSSVGIATRSWLHGPGIESRWGRDFPHPVQTGPGVHPSSYTMRTGSFPGVKPPGRGVDHLPHLVPRLNKEYSYTSTPPLGLRGLF
jgi:hypothetical protein